MMMILKNTNTNITGIKKTFPLFVLTVSALFLTGCGEKSEYGEHLDSILNEKAAFTTITAEVTIPPRTEIIEESAEEIPASENTAAAETENHFIKAAELRTGAYYWSEYIDAPSDTGDSYDPDSFLRYDFIMDSNQHITISKAQIPAAMYYEFDVESIEGNVYHLTNGLLKQSHGDTGYDTEYGFTGTVTVNDDDTFHMIINESSDFDWDFELKP